MVFLAAPFWKDYFHSSLFTANWMIAIVCVAIVVAGMIFFRLRR